MKVKKPRISISLDNQAEITFTCDKAIIDTLSVITGEFVDLVIKEYHPQRTLHQNGYFWSLIDKIASKLGDKPENIYRTYVRDYGVKDYLCIQDEALGQFSKLWCRNGLGWFIDVLRVGKIQDTTTIVCYYGSSSYNTEQMAHLIEPVIEEAEKLGIPTIKLEDFKKLKNDVDKEEKKI